MLEVRLRATHKFRYSDRLLDPEESGGCIIMVSRSFLDTCSECCFADIVPGRVCAVRLNHNLGRLCIVNIHLEPRLAPDGKRLVLQDIRQFLDLHAADHHCIAFNSVAPLSKGAGGMISRRNLTSRRSSAISRKCISQNAREAMP